MLIIQTTKNCTCYFTRLFCV